MSNCFKTNSDIVLVPLISLAAERQSQAQVTSYKTSCLDTTVFKNKQTKRKSYVPAAWKVYASYRE